MRLIEILESELKERFELVLVSLNFDDDLSDPRDRRIEMWEFCPRDCLTFHFDQGVTVLYSYPYLGIKGQPDEMVNNICDPKFDIDKFIQLIGVIHESTKTNGQKD